MSKCQKIQNILSDYRTGVLSASQSANVERHVSECPECARELELLDGVLAMIEDNISEVEPPAGLWNGVYNRITDPTPEHAASGPGFFGWFTKPMRAAGVGLATVALAAALYIGAPRPQTAEPMKMSAADEYAQGHALYASQASLADRATYLTLVTASSDTGVTP